MSLERVQQFVQELPPRLREDVISYARSVDRSAPDIFREARMSFDQQLSTRLVFLAGIKKLYAICSGTYWILDNSLHSLQQSETYEVKIGSIRISRGSREYAQLQALLGDLEELLMKQELYELVQISSYVETLHRLRDEH
jgi:hypothetical protein